MSHLHRLTLHPDQPQDCLRDNRKNRLGGGGGGLPSTDGLQEFLFPLKCIPLMSGFWHVPKALEWGIAVGHSWRFRYHAIIALLKDDIMWTPVDLDKMFNSVFWLLSLFILFVCLFMGFFPPWLCQTNKTRNSIFNLNWYSLFMPLSKWQRWLKVDIFWLADRLYVTFLSKWYLRNASRHSG